MRHGTFNRKPVQDPGRFYFDFKAGFTYDDKTAGAVL
jgi:hypothetical protein